MTLDMYLFLYLLTGTSDFFFCIGVELKIANLFCRYTKTYLLLIIELYRNFPPHHV